MGCAASSSVEDSLCLSVATLVKEKGTVGSWTRGSLRWSYEDRPHAKTGEANLIDPDTAWVRFTYTVNGTPMHYYVRLVTTQPTYGGLPWWFLAPLGATMVGRLGHWQEVLCKPSGSCSHLHLMPGEWEIRRALSSKQTALVRLSLCALHFLISRCSRRRIVTLEG